MAYRHRQIDSALIQWHTGSVRLTALWSNGIQASSDWQHSDPMAYRHRQIDSTLIQWHTGIIRLTVLYPNDVRDPVGRQSYFRVTVPLLFTTLLKCIASMCAHWHHFSWWRPRPPPSSPMPRNGTAHTHHQHTSPHRHLSNCIRAGLGNPTAQTTCIKHFTYR